MFAGSLRLAKEVARRLPDSWRSHLREGYLSGSLRLEAFRKGAKTFETEQIVWPAPEVVDLVRRRICGPGVGEALVRLESTVISPGTEQAALIGLPGATRGFPYNPGYSGVGTVVAVGSGVKRVRVGQRVAGRLPHAGLGVLSEDLLFDCESAEDRVAAAMIEIGIIVLQGMRKARIHPGEPLVVVGCGLIGQVAMRIARIAGAAPVIAVARSSDRRAVALAAGGADLFFDADAAGQDRSIEAGVVVESTGSPAGLQASYRWLKRGGQVILLGSTRGIAPPAPVIKRLSEKDARLVGAHVSIMPKGDSSPGRWTYFDEGRLWLEWARQGRIQAEHLVTHRLSPNEAVDFYLNLVNNRVKPVGAVIEWARSGMHREDPVRRN